VSTDNAILDLLNGGFALCRIPCGEKNPTDLGWQLKSATADECIDHNVGIICGPLSGGVVCVDLDGIEVVTADHYLPTTAMEDGRPGSPRAHRWYRITDTIWPDDLLPGPSTATRRAMDAGLLPRFCGSRNLRSAIDRKIGVEVKGAGTQATVPPSMTKHGPRAWEGGRRGDPDSINYADLLAAVENLAEAVGWRRPMKRNEAATASAYARLGMSDAVLLARARGARNGDRFAALWNKPDATSEDDAALLGMLSFWTHDADQLDRLWLASPCGSRLKTQSRSDYRARSIAFIQRSQHV
jgi:hypothetical protein